MGNEIKAGKFLKSEEEARTEWLTVLASDQRVPVDVTFRAKYKIEREYYPYAQFDITCEADWSATSIWEHKEKYQVPREETVYIDYRGDEHATSGSDTEIRNGRSIKHYRKPMSRTVYDTKYRTVVDNVEQTQGEVGPRSYIKLEPLNISLPDVDWAESLEDTEFDMMDVDSLDKGDVKFAGFTVSDSDARASAEAAAHSAIADYASDQVPGTRYENFGLTYFDVISCQQTNALLPVYHISYTYDEEEYECYLSGVAEGDYQFLGIPEDSSIVEHDKKLEEHEEKTSFSSRKFLFAIGALALLWLAWHSVPSALEWHDDFMDVLIAFLQLVGGLYCLVRFLIMFFAHRKYKSEHERFKQDNDVMRRQILEIVQNEGMSEEEKEQTIQKWVADHASSLGSGAETADEISRKQKKQTRMANIGGLAGVAAALLLSIGLTASSCAADAQLEQESYGGGYGFGTTETELY